MASRAPIGALRKAQREVDRRVRGFTTVVSIGLGHKRSRRFTANNRYGIIARPCVKVFVSQKRKKPKRGEHIPKWVDITWRGTNYRIPTDVESIGRPRLQAIPTVTGRMVGTPSFVAREVGVTRTRLVTAGHVLRGHTSQVRLNAQPIGLADLAASWFASSTHPTAVVDAGVVPVSEQMLGPLRRHPWNAMTNASIVRSSEIDAMLNTHTPVIVQIFGAVNRSVFRVDSIIREPTELIGGYPPFAPILYYLTAESGHTEVGDSGAPVVLANTSRLIGFHIVGNGDSARRTWMLSAASALNELSVRLSRTLTLTPP